MCDDDDDDESCNKCYALIIIVVFKQRDLKKMCRVFCGAERSCFFLFLKKKCRHTTRVAGSLYYIRSFNNNSNYICTRKRS